MAELRVVGFDPSLRHWGIASGVFDTTTQQLDITDVSVIEPVVSKSKQVRNNSKDLSAAIQLAEGAVRAAKGADAIFVEVPHGSQSARAMASYGICVGILGTLRAGGIQYYELTQGELKLTTLGKTKSSKAEAINWATSQWPNAPWSTYEKNGKTLLSAAKVEHQADAAAAIYTGVRHQDFLRALQLNNSRN